MNPNKILAASLALNLTLAGGAIYIFQKPGVASISEKPAAIVIKIKKEPQHSAPVREIQSGNEIASGNEFTWRKLEAKDFKIYIANLRAADCPEETIRDIITAEVNKLYASRIRAVRQGNQPPSEYWQTGRNAWDPKKYYEQQKQIRAIEKEKSSWLVDLLGMDPNAELTRENQSVDYWERGVQFLPEDKREAALEIQMKYMQREQEIHRGGVIDDEDRKRIRELYQQRLAELGAILTPQELSEYDIRASQVASQLRYDLELFKPSEDEFRKIFAFRKAREEDLAHVYDQEDKAGRERREKAVKETDDQIRELLGEERFALYKRSPDWNYRELVRVAERMELPRENVDKVYNMKKIVEDTASGIRSNKELTQEQQTEALKSLREETEKTITDALGGERGWKKYNERQGWWLNNVSQRKRP
jgi:hypothetical protein